MMIRTLRLPASNSPWLGSGCSRAVQTSGNLLFPWRWHWGSKWESSRDRSSMQEHFSISVDVGNRPITFSTGKYANLADAAAVVQSGNTTMMVTAVSKRFPQANTRGLPLLVDYRERAAAAGRIPQNFLRRELAATANETLVSRAIDRSVRPLFPSGYGCETQVICNMLALDSKHDPEILSINGASAALMLSDIPWNGPIGAVRVGLVDGKFCINPNQKELWSSKLDLIVASTKDKLVMIEGSAVEVEEEQFCEAVLCGFEETKRIVDVLEELKAQRKRPVRDVPLVLPPNDVKEMIISVCQEHVTTILSDPSHTKASRDNAMFALLDEVKPAVVEKYPDVPSHIISDAFWGLGRKILQSNVLDHGIRCDGRGMQDLRPIHCEVDMFKPLHGSSIFKRGETQVFCTVTFDSPESAAKADLVSMILGSQRSKRFMLHYEFPPFATNEIGRFLVAGRREIGHGALAEKALRPLLPSEDFTFTIRLNSQVLDSNGSSSMASVCGGSLALFDAGVPMSRAAAGVACGLVVRMKPGSDEIENYQILTDISGIEDALGCMDFKVAGTRQGITSLQMDIKDLWGIPYHIFEEAIMQSRDARYQMLDIMDECQSTPRPQLKENGPAYATIEVPLEKRGKLIGLGGHRVRALVADTGAELQTISDESMSIFAPNRDVMDDVMERIEAILEEEPEQESFEVGAIYPATITDIRQYGLLVELVPGVSALLHNSQISARYVDHPSELGFILGQRINVKYLGKDPMTGRHKISRKALLTFSSASSPRQPGGGRIPPPSSSSSPSTSETIDDLNNDTPDNKSKT